MGKRLAGDTESSRQLDIVLTQTRRLEQLVDGVLKAGREVPIHVQELDPREVLEVAYRAAVERMAKYSSSSSSMKTGAS